jgi:hypothetical protein
MEVSNGKEKQKSSPFSFAINDRYGPTGYTLSDLKFLASVVGSYTGGMIFLQNIFPKLVPSSWTNLTLFLSKLSKSSMHLLSFHFVSTAN